MKSQYIAKNQQQCPNITLKLIQMKMTTDANNSKNPILRMVIFYTCGITSISFKCPLTSFYVKAIITKLCDMRS